MTLTEASRLLLRQKKLKATSCENFSAHGSLRIIAEGMGLRFPLRISSSPSPKILFPTPPSSLSYFTQHAFKAELQLDQSHE